MGPLEHFSERKSFVLFRTQMWNWCHFMCRTRKPSPGHSSLGQGSFSEPLPSQTLAVVIIIIFLIWYFCSQCSLARRCSVSKGSAALIHQTPNRFFFLLTEHLAAPSQVYYPFLSLASRALPGLVPAHLRFVSQTPLRQNLTPRHCGSLLHACPCFISSVFAFDWCLCLSSCVLSSLFVIRVLMPLSLARQLCPLWNLPWISS